MRAAIIQFKWSRNFIAQCLKFELGSLKLPVGGQQIESKRGFPQTIIDRDYRWNLPLSLSRIETRSRKGILESWNNLEVWNLNEEFGSSWDLFSFNPKFRFQTKSIFTIVCGPASSRGVSSRQSLGKTRTPNSNSNLKIQTWKLEPQTWKLQRRTSNSNLKTRTSNLKTRTTWTSSTVRRQSAKLNRKRTFPCGV